MSRPTACSAADGDAVAGPAASAVRLGQPAGRLLERRQPDPGGVHHRADLHLRQVALLFHAAVFDHRHVAPLAPRRLVAAHDGAQAARRTVALRQPGLAFERARAGLQLRQRPAGAESEQLLQIRRGLRQQHRHRPDQRVEGAVGAHQHAGVVEQHHPQRAQVEPVVEFPRRAVGAVARRVLGTAVLQRHEGQRAPVCVEQAVAGLAQPALPPAGVDHSRFEQPCRIGSIEIFAQPLADSPLCGAIFRWLEVDRIDADQFVMRKAAELDEGRVHVEDAKVGPLQQGRERRVPDHCELLGRHRPQHHPHRRRRGGRRRRVAQQPQRPVARVEPLQRDVGTAAVGQGERERRAAVGAAGQHAPRPTQCVLADERPELLEPPPRLATEPAHRRSVGERDPEVAVQHQHGVGQQVEQPVKRRRCRAGFQRIHRASVVWGITATVYAEPAASRLVAPAKTLRPAPASPPPRSLQLSRR